MRTTAQMLLPALLCTLLTGSEAVSQTGLFGGSGSAGPVKHFDPADSQPVKQGNILILLGDDVGVDMIGAYNVGSDLAPTPNIDSLASRGVMFENAWSNPVCSPTRATIQTGRYSFRTGVGMGIPCLTTPYGLPMEELTLPEMLQFGTTVQYSSAAIGKWHMSTLDDGLLLAPNAHGYDHYEGYLCGEVGDYYDWIKTTNGQNSRVQEYVTVHNTNAALNWISQAHEPWLCYVSYNNPHSPFHIPPANLHTNDLSNSPPPSVDPRPYYKAQVEAMDTEIGRLLAGVGTKLDRTTVFFIGDNGTPGSVIRAPYQPDRAKGSLYQGGVNVPFIVAGPQVTVSGRSAALVGTVDVFSTVMELAGIDRSVLPVRDGILDSVSLVPYFTNPALPSIRETILAETFGQNGEFSGVRTCPNASSVCQPDLGYGGPGNARLQVCGQPLYAQNQASLELSGAPPNAPAFFFVSPEFRPRPMLGGIITPDTEPDRRIVFTDSNGAYSVPNVDLVDYYAHVLLQNKKVVNLQFAVLDRSKSELFAISNTVAMNLPGWNVKAIRGTRYKLIIDVTGGPMEFYDLQSDPLEASDLLQSGLTAQQQARFDFLYAEVMGTLDSSIPGACDPN